LILEVADTGALVIGTQGGTTGGAPGNFTASQPAAFYSTSVSWSIGI